MRDIDQALRRLLLERGLLTVRELDEALAEQPEPPDGLARLLVTQGLMGETRVLELEREAKMALGDGTSSLADQKFAQVISALQAGRMGEAIYCVKEMSRGDRGGDVVRSARAKLEEGEAALSLAIERQPNNFEVWTQRGLARLARAIVVSLEGHDPAEPCKGALEDLTRAATLRPDSSSAHVNRASLLLFCARFARATGKEPMDLLRMSLEELDQACRLEAQNPEAFHNRGMAHFYLAHEAKRSASDADPLYERAIQDFTCAATLHPQDPYVYKDLGVAKVAMAKERLARGLKVKVLYEEALDHLSLAIRLQGDLYGAWYERGHAHFALKEFAEAILDWERALEIDPSRADAVCELIAQARAWIARRGPKT